MPDPADPRRAAAERAIAAAGLIPAGHLEPADDTARAWAAAHGPIPVYRLPARPGSRRSRRRKPVILAMLAASPDGTADTRQIATALNLVPSDAWTLLRYHERRGLIERVTHTGRGVPAVWRITPAGRTEAGEGDRTHLPEEDR